MMRLFYLIIFSFCVTIKLFGQTDVYKNEFGFKTENDAYLGIKQDRYYTNGLFLYFRSALNPSKNQDTSKLIKKIWGLSAGQKMYNAYSGYAPNKSYIDRPFAAYLYASTSLQWLFKNENIFKVELQGGTIGPAALGEEGQKLYHGIFGFYELNGWQYQINNEVSLNLILNYDKLLIRSASEKTDLSLPIETRIGNTFSGLKTGLLFRTGNINPLYQSSATNSHVANYNHTNTRNKEFYFFLKPSLDLVLYDATISGGLFNKNKGEITFDTKPLVFSQELGLAFSANRWSANFSLIFKSKEVKSNAKPHQYGIIDLYYRFN